MIDKSIQMRNNETLQFRLNHSGEFFLHHWIKRLAVFTITITMICLGGVALSADPLNAPYIPRTVLFTPPPVMAIKISPDSQYLAYVKAEPSGVMNLYVCSRNQCNQSNALRQLTHFTTPEIYRFFWTDDSKNIVFLQDTNGSKSYQLYSVNMESGTLKNHTADFKNITAKIFKVSGHRVAVGINDRNPKYHDVFILDTSNDSLTKIFENDRFFRFTFDDNLNIVFKEEVHDDGSIDIYKDNAVYMHFSSEDAFHSRLLRLYNSTLYYVDSRNSNTTWLKSIDLTTGKETKLAHNPKSDINEIVFLDNHPLMYSTNWLTKEWRSLGSENFDLLQKTIGTNFEVTNQSKLFWIIRAYHPQKIGASFYLYDLETKQLTPLFIAKTEAQLAKVTPFEFKTRDGLILTAYITLPNGMNSFDSIKKPVPLIVFPHGGPFQARDSLIYNPYAQWLASRGYAVLNVNFRLSSGLGKNLVNAGNGEWGRKALFDLIDGVTWCIDKGITTTTKVGIMGGSYGGYATLAGLSFTPEEFAVGVSIVGPSSLITVMQKVPTYWDFPNYPLSDSELLFTKGAFIKSMGGSPDTPEGQQFLASRSPLNFANQIERPLLLIQGDNDPIVTKEESQQIFDQLKQSKKKVRLLSFSDEGHQFRRYANIDVYLAYAEKWLHDVLGGRFEPVDPTLMKESSVTIQESYPPTGGTMKLSSSAFKNADHIPRQYTCDGANINPPLDIADIPAGTKSLVLILEDPDVPRYIREDQMWDHWIVFNIPPNTTRIDEGTEPLGQHGLGTGNNLKYYGPCPPDAEHRYFFKLYALDSLLTITEKSTKKQVEAAMKGHILAHTELMGIYGRG